MSFSPLIDELIRSLTCLPGVGTKSAQRMAFYLLQQGRPQAKRLASTLLTACEQISHCEKCHTLSETPLCSLCNHPGRDRAKICIVESPIDVIVIEQTGSFKGVYFVLMGRLSPIDGINANDLGLPLLEERLKQGEITEVILAINPTVEGEATAYYIADMVKKANIAVSRLARGVPLGGELEFIDDRTLSAAIADRHLL